RGGPRGDSHGERGARRGEPFAAPGIRGPRRPHPGGRRAGLAGPGRLGGRAGAGHAGSRSLQPRPERIPRQRARERGRRQRLRRRPLGGRRRGLPGARLHQVRGTVDDAARARGDPPRARGRERDGAPAAGERGAHPRGGSKGGRSRGTGAAGGSRRGSSREGAGRPPRLVRLGRGPHRLADGADRRAADRSPAADRGGAVSAARALLIFVASAFLAPTVPAAETVDQIVARHVAARGGRPALAAVRTLRMAGHAVAGPGRRAIVRREIARPDRIRTEFEFQGTLGVYVWNGKSGWQVSPLDGQLDVQPLSPEAAALSAEQADFEGPLVDWKAKGNSVQLVGRAALPGGPADELKVTLKSG